MGNHIFIIRQNVIILSITLTRTFLLRSVSEVLADRMPEHLQQQPDDGQTAAVYPTTVRIPLQLDSSRCLRQQPHRVPAQPRAEQPQDIRRPLRLVLHMQQDTFTLII